MVAPPGPIPPPKLDVIKLFPKPDFLEFPNKSRFIGESSLKVPDPAVVLKAPPVLPALSGELPTALPSPTFLVFLSYFIVFRAFSL